MIDVEGMIRQASTRVSIDQLIRKGKRYIHVLSREKIDELINRSIRTIVDKHRLAAAHSKASLGAQIEAESRAEFEELLQQYQETTAAKKAVEVSKQTLELELGEIRFELDPQTEGVEGRPPGNARTAPLGAFEDFIRELDKQVVQVFEVRKLILERSESPEAARELDRVEGVLRAILSKLVHVERERFTASGGDPREVATLKKRLEKLAAYVATMEAALKTLSNQQVQNLLRELGLAPEDKNFEKKKEMLKVVLSANQGIRKKARELAARGITLEAPEEKADFSDASESLAGVFSGSSV
jgi:hypothetical protein